MQDIIMDALKRFTLTAFLLFSCASISLAETKEPAAISEPTIAVANSNSPDATTNSLDVRVAALAKLSLDELRAAFDSAEKKLPEIAVEVQAKEDALRELRIASQQHESILAIRKEIAALQQKIETTLDELPDVKAKREEADKVRQTLSDEMQFRTTLMRLIGAKEREAAKTAKPGEQQ